jgi:predicted transcriptional regulator
MGLKFENQNDEIVYNTIKKHQPIDRESVAKLTGFPRSTIFDATDRLILRGLIKKEPEKNRMIPGRPKIFYKIKAKKQKK